MLLRWGLAGVLILHGIGHLMFPATVWADAAMGFTASPWLLPGALTVHSSAGQISAVVWLVALVLFLAAAIGLVRRASWWTSAVLTAAVLSLLVLVLWWNTITPESRVWVALVDVAIIAALAGPWRANVMAAID